MTDAYAVALARLAPLMRGLAPSSTAKPYYELLSDALIWTDEMPATRALTAIENWGVLRCVLHARTRLILGEPSGPYQDVWDEARRLFPEWPGFAPSRSAPDHRDLYDSLSADSRREIEELEDLYDSRSADSRREIEELENPAD